MSGTTLRLLGLLLLGACSPDLPGRACRNADDCFTQERCVAGACVEAGSLLDRGVVAPSDLGPDGANPTDMSIPDVSSVDGRVVDADAAADSGLGADALVLTDAIAPDAGPADASGLDANVVPDASDAVVTPDASAADAAATPDAVASPDAVAPLDTSVVDGQIVDGAPVIDAGFQPPDAIAL